METHATIQQTIDKKVVMSNTGERMWNTGKKKNDFLRFSK